MSSCFSRMQASGAGDEQEVGVDDGEAGAGEGEDDDGDDAVATGPNGKASD